MGACTVLPEQVEASVRSLLMGSSSSKGPTGVQAHVTAGIPHQNKRCPGVMMSNQEQHMMFSSMTNKTKLHQLPNRKSNGGKLNFVSCTCQDVALGEHKSHQHKSSGVIHTKTENTT